MRLFGLILAVLAVLTATVDTRAAAPNLETVAGFDLRLSKWEERLDRIDIRLAGRQRIPPATIDAYRGEAVEMESQALKAAKGSSVNLSEIEAQLTSLGPAPKKGEPEEPVALQQTRERLSETLARIEAQVKRSELVAVRASQLFDHLGERRRREIESELSQRYPSPLIPSVAITGLTHLVHAFGEIVATPVVYLTEELDPDAWAAAAPMLGLLIVTLVVVVWWVRSWLSRHWGRDHTVTDPGSGRMLLAQLVVVFVDGALLSALVMIPVWVLRRDGLIVDQSADILEAAAEMTVRFLMIRAVLRATLAPENSQWRVGDISEDSARATYWRTVMLAVIFHIILFLAAALTRLDVSHELSATFTLAVTVLLSFNILALLRPAYWRHGATEPSSEADVATEQDASTASGALKLGRFLLRLIALSAPIAAAAGYTQLAQALILRTIDIAIVIGLVYLVRAFLREVSSLALEPDGRVNSVARRLFSVGQDGLERALFWVLLALDLVLIVLAAGFVGIMLGVSPHVLLQLVGRTLQGFSVGGVTISPGSIVAGIAVFIALMLATRFLQRVLSQRVLPRTQLDVGVRHSIAAATGYVGITLAAIVAVAMVGLDLSNLAIIAGALSVGIGFGLQAIVNNFAAGLIILAERPIKVGDWIKIGANQGTVKRINVRSTEIETFQRQSVIVPNAEVISTALINYTHKDRFIRIEIPVGVAYGSDTEQVRDLLQEIGQAHPNVAAYPAPMAVFLAFGASSLDFQLRLYLGNVDHYMIVWSDIHFAIDKAFRDHGIEIPFPQQDVHLRDIDRLTRDRDGGGGTA